jgi:ABC-2 type transport system ATP-binding protein
MMLKVNNISKSYDFIKVVDDLSFSIDKGSVCGFIGPNGAGKTTTMRICSTLLLPDSGDVLVDGYSVLSHPREARKMIGFMPDSFPIEDRIVVADMIEFFGRSHGMYGSYLRETMDAVIDFTNLENLLKKEFGALSKGMKQRAALATTLMHDPQLLILDEPAAGLDPRARVELRDLITSLAEQGKSVLISSHILAELSEICDQVVVIEQGKLCGEGNIRSMQKNVNDETKLWLTCLTEPEMVAAYLEQQTGVSNVEIDKGYIYFSFIGGLEEQSSLMHNLFEQGYKPLRFAEREVDLEDVFLNLTEGRVQ